MEPLVIGPVAAERAPFLEVSEAAWADMIAGLRDAFLTLQRYAAEVRDGGGRVVVISSPASARAMPGMGLEATAGAFLTTIAQVAAIELRPRGITANVVVPAPEPDSGALDAVIGFLASEDAAGVTGAVIAADGGFCLTKGDS